MPAGEVEGQDGYTSTLVAGQAMVGGTREVERLLIISGLLVLAGLCEIGGGYLVWG